jgi:hypothetical protein
MDMEHSSRMILPDKNPEPGVDHYSIPDPSQILMIGDFIDARLCRELCEFVEKGRQKELAERGINLPTDGSRSAFCGYTGAMSDMLRSLFHTIFTQHVEPFFNVSIEWWERPQLLCYAPGGRYDPHSDSEDLRSNNDGTPGKSWQREHDRDISVLLYLNREFEGGDLVFPKQQLRISPRPGLLLAYPSHSGFLHGAEPTLSGLRYVTVTWAGVKGGARVRSEPPKDSIYMTEFKGVDE